MVVKKTQKNNKMKGGSPSEGQKKAIYILSTILALSSLGYLSYCTVSPVVEQLLLWLHESGIKTVNMTFYELLDNQLKKTMESVMESMSQTAAAVGSATKTFSYFGNTCAIMHAGSRLANPLYHFFLEFIKQIASVMQNPLQLNQGVQALLGEIATTINKTLSDYNTIGKYAIKGADKSSAFLIDTLYPQISKLTSQAKQSVIANMPKQDEGEKAAQRQNIEMFSKYVNIINTILTTVVIKGGQTVKKPMDWCSRATVSAVEYGKWFVSFFKKSAKAEGIDEDDFFIEGSSSPSPSRSPSPKAISPTVSPIKKEKLNAFMMYLRSTPEPSSGSAKDARAASENSIEIASMKPSTPVKCRARSEPAHGLLRPSLGGPRFISEEPSMGKTRSGKIRFNPLPLIKEKSPSPWPADQYPYKSPTPPSPGTKKKQGGTQKKRRQYKKRRTQQRK